MELCPECGLDHHPAETEAAAEVAAAELIAEGAEGAAHEEGLAGVEVARIEADRDVEVARIQAKVEAGWQEARVAELEGKVSGMQEVIGRLTEPPAAPADPPPAPPVEVVDGGPPPPDETKTEPPRTEKKPRGWWG
jgi:hypothetical protein